MLKYRIGSHDDTRNLDGTIVNCFEKEPRRVFSPFVCHVALNSFIM